MSEDNVKCPKCNSSFNKMFLMEKHGNADVCPVCGESLLDNESSAESKIEATKWYYYR